MRKMTSSKKQSNVKSDGLSPQRDRLRALLDHPKVRSWRALMLAFKAIFTQLEKGLMVEDCSVSRFQILFHLYFEGSMPAIAIAKKLLVTRGNITMFLRRMESDGLIKPVVPSGQKRPVFTLTMKGTRFFEQIFPRHIERVHQYAPVFDKETLRLLKQIQAERLL